MLVLVSGAVVVNLLSLSLYVPVNEHNIPLQIKPPIYSHSAQTMLGKISRKFFFGGKICARSLGAGSEDGTEVPRGCEGKRGSGME